MISRALRSVAPAAFLTLVALAFVQPPAAAQQEEEKASDTETERIEVRATGPDSHGPEAGWLGVRVEDLDAEDAAERGWEAPRGARVAGVRDGSPAAEAGLREGDVVVRFDGESVRSAAELGRLVRETPAGRRVELRIVRDGGERSLSVKVGERPGPRFRVTTAPGWRDIREGLDDVRGDLDEEELERIRERTERARELWDRRMEEMHDDRPSARPGVHVLRAGGPPRLGIRMHTLTDQLAEHFGVDDRGGVLVASVREGSAAAEAGLQAGDVVVRFGEESVEDPGDLAEAVHRAEAGPVSVTIVREAEESQYTVELPERHGVGWFEGEDDEGHGDDAEG